MTVPDQIVLLYECEDAHLSSDCDAAKRCQRCGLPVREVLFAPVLRTHRRALRELLFRVKPILASFRSTDMHVTEAQIESAWSAFQAACEVAGGPFSRPESPIKGQGRG